MTGLACAQSQWVWYGRTQESQFYYDPVNIRQAPGFLSKTPHLWRAWTIEDRERPTVSGAYSERSLYEYDCDANRFRVVQQESYSDAMMGGHRVERSSRASDWIPVVANTAPATLREIVCEQYQGTK